MSVASATPLLSTRCRLPTRTLWFGRALLHKTRICIRGWTLRGRYRRVVPLDRIDRVKWWAVLDDVNFVLCLDDDSTVPLQLMKGAGRWNVKLHELLDKSLLAHHAMPGVENREPAGC